MQNKTTENMCMHVCVSVLILSHVLRNQIENCDNFFFLVFPFPSPVTIPMTRRHALWGWGSVMVTMVPGSRYVCSTHATDDDSTNDREERILAVLGIIGTVLNLLVVIFVYIYTSVT